MTNFYQILQASLIAILIFTFNFSFSQEQPIDKSGKIQDTNELLISFVAATQMPLKIEPLEVQTKTDNEQRYEKKKMIGFLGLSPIL